MDRETVDELWTELEKVIEDSDLAERFDVNIELGAASYSDDDARISVVLVDASAGNTLMEADWHKHAHLYGFKPDDLGKQFELRGCAVTIIGLKRRNKKYPIIVENGGGQRFKLPAPYARGLMPT